MFARSPLIFRKEVMWLGKILKFPVLADERKKTYLHRHQRVIFYTGCRNRDVQPDCRNGFFPGQVDGVTEQGNVRIIPQEPGIIQARILRTNRNSTDIMKLRDWLYFLDHPDDYKRWLDMQREGQSHSWEVDYPARLQAFANAIGKRDRTYDRMHLFPGDPIVKLALRPEVVLIFGNIDRDGKRIVGKAMLNERCEISSLQDAAAIHGTIEADGRNGEVGEFILPRVDYEWLRTKELKEIADFFQTVSDQRWLNHGQFLLQSFQHITPVKLDAVSHITCDKEYNETHSRKQKF